MKEKVIVNDKTQENYEYYRTEKAGENFDEAFKPELTPSELLELGIFGGKYMTDCKDEFPHSLYENAKLSFSKKNKSLNYYNFDASMPLSHWQ